MFKKLHLEGENALGQEDMDIVDVLLDVKETTHFDWTSKLKYFLDIE
jgi:hypothetical protein